MDNSYCNEKCAIGKAAREIFLAKDNSVLDAAHDFQAFVENCFKACPYKSKHNKVKDNK